MAESEQHDKLAAEVRRFVRASFSPRFGELAEKSGSHPTWARLRQLGTELWLDTGSLEDCAELWTRDFAALTTNNTLLNKEVQTGRYDALVGQAAELLAPHGLSERQRILEIAFILNARHALTLVEEFDAFVSVEEHTDLAHDLPRAVDVARRYHAICPERFFVKIPLTPAGILATRRLAREGVPVNHTLGFSARHNYVVARVARPAYVNVFLGRLNSFVADNDLGTGAFVGERATLASQAAVRQLRTSRGIATRQIGASLRAGEQVRDLAGLDVMTIPPKAAKALLALGLAPEQLTDRTATAYEPQLAEGLDPAAVGLDTLWNIGAPLVACVDALEQENLDSFTPDDLVAFFADHGCPLLFPRWTDAQVATSADEGKIPRLDHWREPLAAGAIGLDSLMNLAGLNSFTADQAAMDDRVASVLAND